MVKPVFVLFCLGLVFFASAQNAESTATSEVSVSCNGDRNARSGCGVNCGRHCNDYNKGVSVCPAICYINACDCKTGFVYDDNIDRCVLPKDCTPVCSKNEVFNSCYNGGCYAPRECIKKGGPSICVDLIEGACKAGCVCKAKYLRDVNGTCIPQDECPPNDENTVLE